MLQHETAAFRSVDGDSSASMPETEKPRHKLTKLIPVQISCSRCRSSNRSGVLAFDSVP